MATLRVMHLSSNSDLPESVRDAVPDADAQTIFRMAMNQALADGRSEMHAYIKGYRELEKSGYVETGLGVWEVQKASPTVGMVHSPVPIGSALRYEQDEDEEEKKRKAKEAGQLLVPTAKGDTIALDVPLFLRLLEVAREDIKSDAPLHVLTEKLVELMEEKPELGMSDYDSIIAAIQKKRTEDKDDPGTQDVDPPENGADFLPMPAGPDDRPEKEDDEEAEKHRASAKKNGAGVPSGSQGNASGEAIIAKRISGSSNIPLNAKGEKLADRLGQRIAARGGLDVLYNSPLRRSVQTADAIARHATRSMRRGKPVPEIQPWHLGEFEGKSGGDNQDLINWFVKHPDEVPPGKGNDGQTGESFNASKKRQLGWAKALYERWQADPTIKIGMVDHSRFEALLNAWVDDDCPADFDVDTKDIEDPPNDFSDHASMKRWNDDKIKDIDLEEDEPFKGGIYLILHSLTDDDTDDGNEELQATEKAAPQIPPHLRQTTGTERCANCSYYDPAGNCKMYDHYPVQADQVCDSWTGKPDVKKYLPPIEIAKAARAAYASGNAVIDITAPLAEGGGLSVEALRKIAEHFADGASATEPSSTRDAWGGTAAGKWAAKIVKKEDARRWPQSISVDLDGTLAAPLESYDGTRIGHPIPKMVDYVKWLLAEGKAVKIFTARVADDPDGKIKRAIEFWCKSHIGQVLPVTNEKDPGMVELIDDRSKRPDEVAKAGNGVLIAFWPDAETQKALAVPGGETPEDIHLTLAYLGKQEETDPTVMPVIENAIRVFASNEPPISGIIGGIGRFPATLQSDGQDVAYRSFHSDDIQQFRQKLVDAIKQGGGKPRENFGYTPHITLKFLAPHAPHLLATPENIPVTFDRITLSIGGEKKEFPLSGQTATIKREEECAFELSGNIIKIDRPQHLVFGWASIVSANGKPVVDTQADVILPKTLEAAVYSYCLDARVAGEMHETDGDGKPQQVGELVESVFFDDEKVQAMTRSLNDQGIPATMFMPFCGWWIGFRISSESCWQSITSGELRSFSVGGKGKRAAIAG